MTEALLNHFYVTPDRETFDAAAEILPRFGALERRTTVRKDVTYTGLYLYGQHTYLELLSPGSAPFGEPSGIAYGVDDAPGLARICRAFHGEQVEEIFRGEVPWFRRCQPEAPLPGLTEWAMEYIPEFFRRFHPRLPPAQPGISRADALTRYAAACGKLRERDEGLFGDVAALSVALFPRDAERWNTRDLRVSGTEVRVSPADPGRRTGILAARLRLRRDAGKTTERIGSTTLSLDGRSAVWRF